MKDWWPVALLCFMTLGTLSCGESDCESWRQWRNAQTQACMSCESTMCAMQSLQSPMLSSCADEFACMDRCPASSAATCGCIDMCLTTDMCKTAFNALISCYVQKCSATCQ